MRLLGEAGHHAMDCGDHPRTEQAVAGLLIIVPADIVGDDLKRDSAAVRMEAVAVARLSNHYSAISTHPENRTMIS